MVTPENIKALLNIAKLNLSDEEFINFMVLLSKACKIDCPFTEQELKEWK